MTVCIGLIFIVLIQGGKGASLSASFGMGGGASSAFGAQTDTFIIKWTRNIAITFLVTSLGLAYLTKHTGSLVQRTELMPTTVEEPQAAAALPLQVDEVDESQAVADEADAASGATQASEGKEAATEQIESKGE
ncbi:MAG: preprotein translocase subunit SecG [Candidatus Lindowbacteria bacterium]|nr:preprotein translocase subunit SecG [Candidatus Lindowbacteria bacterium]